MENIESYSYTSPLRLAHPNIKLFAALITLSMTVFCYHFTVSAVVYIATFLVAIVFLKVKPKSFYKLMAVPLSFIALSVVTIIIEFGAAPAGSNVLVSFWGIANITSTSLMRGFALAMTAMACANTMYLLALTTPIIDFCEGLGKMHLPNSIVTLMLMIYRLIFVVSDMATKMRIAQTARLGYRTFKSSIEDFGVLVSSIFIRSIKRTSKLYNALEARGYNGNIKVLSLDYKMRYDLLAIVVVFNCVLLAMWVFLWM